MSLIIDWLFPQKCFGCHKGNKYLCSLCEEKLTSGLLSQKKSFEGIISVYKYDNLMKIIIEKIKYEFISDALEEMASLMSRKLKLDYPNIVKYWQKEDFVLIPIPLFWQRKNWRGFNQSEILSKYLAKFLNLKYDENFLKRKVKTRNQATIKNRELRGKNIKNVFEIDQKKNIKRAILIDDVITSGATMTAAQKTLEESGVQKVWGLSLSGVQK